MTGLKVIDGTPTEISKYLREKDKIIEETLNKYYSKEYYRKGFNSGEAMMRDLLGKLFQSQKQKIIEEIEKTSKKWYKIIKRNIKDKYWQSSELNLIQQIEKELLKVLGEKC